MLYRGGFLAYAALSAAVIAACLSDRGPVARLLSWSPLRWVGRVSYGAYLYHWPLFLVLDEARTGCGPGALFMLRVAATLGLAGLSYTWVEEPLRRGRLLPAPWFARTMTLGGTAVVALALATSPVTLEGHVDAITDHLPFAGPAVGEDQQQRFAIFGDSMAYTLWPGLGSWAKENPGARTVKGLPVLGCGLGTPGFVSVHGSWVDKGRRCADIPARWRKVAESNEANVALVLVGARETRDWTEDRRNGTVRALGDPVFDERVREAIGAAMDALIASGARVVWLTVPPLKRAREKGATQPPEPVDPARVERMNQLIENEAALRADRVQVLDLASIIQQWPGGAFDEALRHDGIHFSDKAARKLFRGPLGEELARAARPPA